mmetsp:Transcript_25114/g.62819  ORF Transcript_25114/g.62819 Transcript_25114/m.62819 type:complete len:263 (+) Transcript_25114:1276-2064(+)
MLFPIITAFLLALAEVIRNKLLDQRHQFGDIALDDVNNNSIAKEFRYTGGLSSNKGTMVVVRVDAYVEENDQLGQQVVFIRALGLVVLKFGQRHCERAEGRIEDIQKRNIYGHPHHFEDCCNKSNLEDWELSRIIIHQIAEDIFQLKREIEKIHGQNDVDQDDEPRDCHASELVRRLRQNALFFRHRVGGWKSLVIIAIVFFEDGVDDFVLHRIKREESRPAVHQHGSSDDPLPVGEATPHGDKQNEKREEHGRRSIAKERS